MAQAPEIERCAALTSTNDRRHGRRGGSRPEPVDDYGPVARATLAAVPDLLRQAEAAGAVTLARFLGQALTEAEGILRRGEVLSGE